MNINTYIIAIGALVGFALICIVLIARPRHRVVDDLDISGAMMPPGPQVPFSQAVEEMVYQDMMVEEAFVEALSRSMGTIDDMPVLTSKAIAAKLFCVRPAVMDVWLKRHPDAVWTNERSQVVPVGEEFVSIALLMRRRVLEVMAPFDPWAEGAPTMVSETEEKED